ncbi:thiamine biosynthesis protein ThiF [Caenimonas sedimenti]|uniref:Thiamine biosynthesis protein ThiF n=1 Tax=Caenimonas sedimenti TaxID=2596921 RepID=A0A562ZIA6_9BURK|nr:Mov34/MPN/PAD-1 family protein [Caenimonas sedimenti]TWO68066.1 thiamine biosynthesis protein ThiF [Caenimonas sedimenti]
MADTFAFALQDAIEEIARHPAVRAVGSCEQVEGGVVVPAQVSVNLPSRARDGVSATGVREVEQVLFKFPREYPLKGPWLYLREDFPTDMPHINPHTRGSFVPPCVYEGTLNDLVQTDGIVAVVDQLVTWLERAASGQLMNLDQGWEPTRRGEAHATLEFDADAMVRALPQDGLPTVYGGTFAQSGKGVFMGVQIGQTDTHGFRSELITGISGRRIFRGRLSVVVAMAAWQEGKGRVDDVYRPDMVVDIPSLAQRAVETGIDGTALIGKLESLLLQANLAAQVKAPWPWVGDFLVAVVLAVKRPVALLRSGRDIEFVPYVVRIPRDETGPALAKARVEAAFHLHGANAQLLARTSGYETVDLDHALAFIGCGSLGSKISLHLGRAGFGNQLLVDNEALVGHNLARHASYGGTCSNKAENLATTLRSLGHAGARAAPVDAAALFTTGTDFAELLPPGKRLILDSTASPQVAAAATHSPYLTPEVGRLARAQIYNRGGVAVLLLEGDKRTPRCDDLTAELFRRCRSNPGLRGQIKGNAADLTQVMIGDNCRSLTMQMADSMVSRAAAAMAMQVEQWLVQGIPDAGFLCVGYQDAAGIGFSWATNAVLPSLELIAANDPSWRVRVASTVTKRIAQDVQKWGPVETGGAVLGHIDTHARTIVVADIVDAPPDSIRQRDRFVLGTQGLQDAVLQANTESLHYLRFIGTWHSHPAGGPHSQIDKDTLAAISRFAPGLPVVSLVWRPEGFACEVRVDQGRSS